MTEWKKEITANLPEELQLVSHDTYIQRRNIEEKIYKDAEEEEQACYECESRFISKSEFAMLRSLADASAEDAVNEALDDYTSKLIEEGVI